MLYDAFWHASRINELTDKQTNPDYIAVIDAVARRDQIRVLVDGMTADNQLGLTDAVPSRPVVHTDGRLRPIKLGNLTIHFKLTSPTRLYWSGRPAMRIVQALHWLQDTLPTERNTIMKRLRSILNDSDHRSSLRDDLSKACTRCLRGCRTLFGNSCATVIIMMKTPELLLARP
jgi:hypothetical protein